MREALAQLNGLRCTFTATYVESKQFSRGGYPVTRLLFRSVHGAHDEAITDHLWFDQTPTWDARQLQRGDRVRFEARVGGYWKGYIDRRFDYKLQRPTRIVILERVADGGHARQAAPAESGSKLPQSKAAAAAGQLVFPDLIPV